MRKVRRVKKIIKGWHTNTCPFKKGCKGYNAQECPKKCMEDDWDWLENIAVVVKYF